METIDYIVTEADYAVTTIEKTFVALAAEDQGALTTLAASGYRNMISETFQDRTKRLPIWGPANEADWQRLKTYPNTGPNYTYRIRGGRLLLNPAPVAPLPTLAFEYVSSWGVTDSGGTAKVAITADSDLFVFPDNLLKIGLSYRWKREKGLPYQADEATYYDLAYRKYKRRIGNIKGLVLWRNGAQRTSRRLH